MKLGVEVGLGHGQIVLDGDPASPPQKGAQPSQFLAHVCCGQTAGWIKMPLGTEVELSPGNIMLDGDPAPPKSGAQHPQFFPMYCGQTGAWIKMPLDAGVGFGPGHIVLHGDPAPPKKGHSNPNLRLLSVVAKWLNGSIFHLVWT